MMETAGKERKKTDGDSRKEKQNDGDSREQKNMMETAEKTKR